MGIIQRLKNVVPGLKGADRFPTEVYIQTSQGNIGKRKVTNSDPCVQAPEQQSLTTSGTENLGSYESPQDKKWIDSEQERFKQGQMIGGHRSTAGSHANKHTKESIAETMKSGSDATTVLTTRGSCMSLDDVFGGLLMCGRCNRDEKRVPELEAPPILSVPSEISFTKHRPRTWEETHVLLTEVDDDDDGNVSMTGSLLQRLRRRPKGKGVISPRTKVYVEPPRTRKELASVDNSALTGPGGRSTTLENSPGVTSRSRR